MPKWSRLLLDTYLQRQAKRIRDDDGGSTPTPTPTPSAGSLIFNVADNSGLLVLLTEDF